jgi:hypothetical protein
MIIKYTKYINKLEYYKCYSQSIKIQNNQNNINKKLYNTVLKKVSNNQIYNTNIKIAQNDQIFNMIIKYANILENNNDYYNCYQQYIKLLEYASDDKKHEINNKIYKIIILYAEQLFNNKKYWFSYEEYIKALNYTQDNEKIIEKAFETLKLYTQKLKEELKNRNYKDNITSDENQFIKIVEQFNIDSFTKEILKSLS